MDWVEFDSRQFTQVTQVIADVGVLASHYNRYNRIHVLLYFALQILHFKRFMSEYGPPPPFIEQLKILYDEPLLLV